MAVDGITNKPASSTKSSQKTSEPANTSVSERNKARKAESETAVVAIEKSLTPENVTAAIRQQQTAFLGQANDAISSVNQAKDITQQDLKTARKVGKLADDLATLVENGKGDSKKADSIREDINKTLEKRNELAAQADQFNRQGAGVKQVNFGSQNKVVNLGEIKVEKIDAGQLKTADDIKALKAKSESSIAAGQGQRENLRAARQELGDVIGSVKTQVQQLSGNVAEGFDKAQEVATKVSESVRSAGEAGDFSKAIAGQAQDITKKALAQLLSGNA